MGEAAVRAARACGYSNAGTVEFLLDRQGQFYFLEMNTRIQVEHPITEMVVGVDLVKEQIRAADGARLSWKQEDLSQRGHAIECRIYAEDAENGFLPSPGTILFCQEPSGPFVRVDSGIYSGCDVSVHYDPILAKLIVWGGNRPEAIRRMIGALEQYVILGVRTPIRYLKAILEHPAFIRGDTFTDFIPAHMPGWTAPEVPEALLQAALAAAAAAARTKDRSGSLPSVKEAVPGPWQTLGKWEIGMGE